MVTSSPPLVNQWERLSLTLSSLHLRFLKYNEKLSALISFHSPRVITECRLHRHLKSLVSCWCRFTFAKKLVRIAAIYYFIKDELLEPPTASCRFLQACRVPAFGSLLSFGFQLFAIQSSKFLGNTSLFTASFECWYSDNLFLSFFV